MQLLRALFILYLAKLSSAGTLNVRSSAFEARQSASNTSTSAPVVDLGYGIYQGYYNATSELNIYKGFAFPPNNLQIIAEHQSYQSRQLISLRIRYAAPPVGNLRWQKPQPPAENRSQIISAKAYPPRCPQSNDAPM